MARRRQLYDGRGDGAEQRKRDVTKAKQVSTALVDIAESLRSIARSEEIDRKALKKEIIRSLISQIANDPAAGFKATELLAKIMGWGAEKKPQEDGQAKESLTKRLDEMLARARNFPGSFLTMPKSQGIPDPGPGVIIAQDVVNCPPIPGRPFDAAPSKFDNGEDP
jgi:hypothetical protein